MQEEGVNDFQKEITDLHLIHYYIIESNAGEDVEQMFFQKKITNLYNSHHYIIVVENLCPIQSDR